MSKLELCVHSVAYFEETLDSFEKSQLDTRPGFSSCSKLRLFLLTHSFERLIKKHEVLNKTFWIFRTFRAIMRYFSTYMTANCFSRRRFIVWRFLKPVNHEISLNFIEKSPKLTKISQTYFLTILGQFAGLFLT